jgi:hypothetical protein
MDPSVVLQIVTLTIVTLSGIVLAYGRASAEKAAQIAVENANWSQKMAQELQKVRGTERQELRFGAYGELWAKQRALALYDANAAAFDGAAARTLQGELSDWYFSPSGGLLLSRQVRDFYFTLQELLRAVGKKPDWRAERSSEKLRNVFLRVLEREGLRDAQATMAYLKDLDEPGGNPDGWPDEAPALARKWKDDIEKLHARWDDLDPNEQFAVLQQVASTLRTSMVNDVESRSR